MSEELKWAFAIGISMVSAIASAWGFVRYSLADLKGDIRVIKTTLEERRPVVSNHEERLKALEAMLQTHLISLERRLSEMNADTMRSRQEVRDETRQQLVQIVESVRSDIAALRSEISAMRTGK